jgi:N-methylhydantoinase A
LKRFAVDVGGTFTDVIYADDETGEFRLEKVRSTPASPSEAVVESIRRTGVDPQHVPLFIHGTTTALNSLLQRKVSKTGLITTRGFRDVLEIGRCNRPDNQQYNLFWKRPEPFVPRYLRREVTERMSWNGQVITKLDEKEVQEIVSNFKKLGVRSIAVSLINSYANPEHERRIEEIAKGVWPQATISLSHRVAAEWREYERTSTTVMDIVIKEPMRAYIENLLRGLASLGFKGEVLIMHSAGGTLPAKTAAESPISTVISGPVGGVIGALALGEALGLKNIVTGDPGGTSYDVSVIVDGKANLSPDMRLIEKATTYPAIVPSVDIRSIGAGGGSIARVDASGLLHVGPESAGAEPGPMCYGRGGTLPTVTDAAVVNGIIDPLNFLGGEIKLEAELATRGIEGLEKSMKMSLNEVADGVLTVARDNMASAVREILIGEGYNPVDFSMISFGGAGGLFAAHVAQEVGIAKVFVPVAPAYFSAWGMLRSDVVHTFSQTFVSRLDDLDLDSADKIFSNLVSSANELFEIEEIAKDRRTNTYSLDMRYEGQGHNVEIVVPSDLRKGDIKEEIRERFHSIHLAKYGQKLDADVYTINFRLRSIGRLDKPAIPEIRIGTKTPEKNAIKGKRKVFSDGREFDCDIYERERLLSGNRIEGPLIVEEPSHTTLVPKGHVLAVDHFGDLIVETGAN